MAYVYLASPYTDPSPDVMEQRYEAALCATSFLLQQRKWVYSPIVHCHALAKAHGLPRDFEFWGEYNRQMIERCHRLIILRIDGYDRSVGVAAEKEYATSLNIPWEYL